MKHRVNAFFGTDLDIILRSQGIDTLIFMGLLQSILNDNTTLAVARI